MNLERLLLPGPVLEREELDREGAGYLDRLLSRMAAVQRYRIARKYCRGRVVDAACGCGYGSWILSKCPDVTRVHGFDADRAAVDHAREQFGDSALFSCEDVCDEDFVVCLRAAKADTVVSLETIEHLSDAAPFIKSVLESGASRFIVSFPSFETVRFNPYHLRDYTRVEVEGIVGRRAARALVIDDAVHMLVFEL